MCYHVCSVDHMDKIKRNLSIYFINSYYPIAKADMQKEMNLFHVTRKKIWFLVFDENNSYDCNGMEEFYKKK